MCTSSAPSKAVSWAVPAERALVQPQPVGQAGMAPGKEGVFSEHIVEQHDKVNDERARWKPRGTCVVFAFIRKP